MSRKIDRATYGPSWLEVIIGALLSIVLGIVLGAALLILKPIVVVKELPKEDVRDARAVYYVQGSRDATKGRMALAKRKSFAEGQSVTVVEDELNMLAGPAPTQPAPKGAKPADKGAPVASAETFVAGAANFRINEGALHVALPVTFSALGFSQQFVVQTRGSFVKQGDVFVYDPTAFVIGSCPLDRLPFAANYVRAKFLAAQTIPDDISASWGKLANVAIENNALKLTMP